jgi:hypothetical protein
MELYGRASRGYHVSHRFFTPSFSFSACVVPESPLTLPRQTFALTDFAIWKSKTRLLCIAQSLGLRGLVVRLTIRWSLWNFSPAPPLLLLEEG